MTRLEQVIEQVKSARQGGHRPWIYDDNGRIQDHVICGEVLDLLEELKSYEIYVTDEWIERFVRKNKGYNTYNWGANISNDLNYYVKETKDEYIIAIAVHLRGDIRAGYSDWFAVKFDDFYEWAELESKRQFKFITDNLTAEIDIMNECYEVFDHSLNDYIGIFYELEIGDLMERIYNTKEN